LLLGRLRSGGSWFKASQYKRPPLNKWLGKVALLVIPATVGSLKLKDGGPCWSGGKTNKNKNKKQDPISKIIRAKRAGAVTQVVECLPSKCKVLNSNPNTGKK
jgi:hypothetical protein